jgi:S1-C subfamily serine protease
MAAPKTRVTVLAVLLAVASSVSIYQAYQRSQGAQSPAAPPPEQAAIDAAIDEALKEPATRPASSTSASAPPRATGADAADSPPAPASSLPLEELIRRSIPAVVRVETADGFGSGFFIKRDTLLTNVHVVGKASAVTVRMPDNSVHRATVETTAPELDIAILRITDGISDGQPILLLGSGTTARQGQEVIVLGTPMGLQNTVTRGIVSAVRQIGPVTLVQTDAAVNPGNSGGPVLDREGMVIGIATMAVKAGVGQGLSFAVAIDHATALIAGQRPSGAAETPLAGLTEAMNGQPAGAKPINAESDQRREAGTKAFAQAIGQLGRRADELEAYWTQFINACYSGSVTGGFARNWFALFDPRAMKGAVAQGCGAQFGNLQSAANEVRDRVLAADESARQAGVYPGERRDTLRTNKLDYWTR